MEYQSLKGTSVSYLSRLRDDLERKVRKTVLSKYSGWLQWNSLFQIQHGTQELTVAVNVFKGSAQE